MAEGDKSFDDRGEVEEEGEMAAAGKIHGQHEEAGENGKRGGAVGCAESRIERTKGREKMT